jgi:hypothetical protein
VRDTQTLALEVITQACTDLAYETLNLPLHLHLPTPCLLWILPLPLQWILPSTLHLHALLWTTAALAP